MLKYVKQVDKFVSGVTDTFFARIFSRQKRVSSVHSASYNFMYRGISLNAFSLLFLCFVVFSHLNMSFFVHFSMSPNYLTYACGMYSFPFVC